MKINIYTIIFLILINFFSPTVKGQTPAPSASPGDVPPPYQILKKGIAENNYLAPL
jgi:hypothetical protein